MQTSTKAPLNIAKPTSQTIQDKLPEWMDHNQDAVNFLLNIFFIASMWDDFIDRDKLLSDEDIHAVFDTCLLTLPLNPFYTKYFTALYSLLANSIRNWKAANIIENDPASDELALQQAFVLRSSYIDLIGMCAALIKGTEHATNVTKEARTLAGAEGFQGYLTNLKKEKELRHGITRMRN